MFSTIRPAIPWRGIVGSTSASSDSSTFKVSRVTIEGVTAKSSVEGESLAILQPGSGSTCGSGEELGSNSMVWITSGCGW